MGNLPVLIVRNVLGFVRLTAVRSQRSGAVAEAAIGLLAERICARCVVYGKLPYSVLRPSVSASAVIEWRRGRPMTEPRN
jgi:hypothetical protein